MVCQPIGPSCQGSDLVVMDGSRVNRDKRILNVKYFIEGSVTHGCLRGDEESPACSSLRNDTMQYCRLPRESSAPDGNQWRFQFFVQCLLRSPGDRYRVWIVPVLPITLEQIGDESLIRKWQAVHIFERLYFARFLVLEFRN